MKLYHGKYIVTGLAVFLVVAAFPIWFTAATGKSTFENPIQTAEGEQCIEEKTYMRANHMRLLSAWRDEVVRGADRVYEAKLDKKKYEKSLTKTCMACHQADAEGKSVSAATYCLECHKYAGVENYCWDCHVDPFAVAETADDKEGE